MSSKLSSKLRSRDESKCLSNQNTAEEVFGHCSIWEHVCLKPLARSDQHRNFIIDLVQGNLGLPKENFEYNINDLAYLCRQIVPLSKSPGTIEGEVFLSPQLRYFQLFSRLLFFCCRFWPQYLKMLTFPTMQLQQNEFIWKAQQRFLVRIPADNNIVKRRTSKSSFYEI